MRTESASIFACLLLIFCCSAASAQNNPSRDLKKEAENKSAIMLKAMSENRYDAASAMAKNLISSYPDTPEVRESYYVLGLSELHSKQFAKARQNFQIYITKGGATTYQVRARRYLKLLRNNDYDYKPLTLFFEGEFWLERSRPLKTLRLFKEILKDYPESGIAPDALNGLGYVYLVGLKNYSESLSIYKAMYKLHPDDSYTDNAIYGIARSYELSGDKAESISYYKKLMARHALLGTSLGGRSIAAFNEYSRLWHRRASLGLKRLQSPYPPPAGSHMSDYFLLGFGDRLVIENPSESGRYYQLWQKVEEDGLKVNLMEFTLNAKIPVTWENRQELLSMSAGGYAPVVIFQYFDINLSPEFVKANEQNYYSFIRERLIPLLKDIPESYILLEAEFNRGGVGAWAGWDAVAAKAIRIIHKELPQAKVGLTVGDWNFKGRNELKISMKESAKLCDFIGYQFMISEIEENYAQDPAGQLLDRVLDFADFLKTNFNKPLLIGYLGVSTYGGWEQVQAECLETFFNHIPDLKHLGVFGMVYFSYVDDPLKGGWFGPAEQTFGIVASDGSFKPGWHSFNKFITENKRLNPSPFLIEPITFSRPSTADEFPIIIRAELSGPAIWRLSITGSSSDAVRTFQGFSSSINIKWSGDADTGQFGQEICNVELATEYESKKAQFESLNSERLTINAPPKFAEKTIFAEAYSYEIADNTNGTFISSKGYSGSKGLQFLWTKDMTGTVYTIPFNTPIVLTINDSLSLNFKLDSNTAQSIRMILNLSGSEVPFALVPFMHQKADNGWLKAELDGKEILNGFNWNASAKVAQVSLNAIGFQSLNDSIAIHVDNIKITSRTQEQPQSIIPYFQHQITPKQESEHQEDRGHIKFFPRR